MHLQGLHEKCATILMDEDGLELYIKRVCNTGDELLMKFIRNLSSHAGDSKMMFLVSGRSCAVMILTPLAQDYIDELVSLARDSPSPAFQVEALGVLAGLTIADFNYRKLIEEFDLLSLIYELIQPGERQVW